MVAPLCRPARPARPSPYSPSLYPAACLRGPLCATLGSMTADLSPTPAPQLSPTRRAFGVYIGRFEPPHLAHQAVMREALEQVETLILVIGSARAARNTKNPFTAQEREAMIRAMLTEAGVDPSRLRFVAVRDHLYDEERWLAEVRSGVQAVTVREGSADVALIGHIKDGSSYYLRSFPDWDFLPTHVVSDLSATAVRRALFEGRLDDLGGMVPPAVEAFLRDFQQSAEYAALRAEYGDLLADRAALDPARTPPTAVMAHAAVTRAGHVLLLRRGVQPGRGNLALPGRELLPAETLIACAARAAQLDTGLDVPSIMSAGLRAAWLAGQVFDAPDRSQWGRVVTHAFPFDLGNGALPDLHPGGDAAQALWVPFAEALGSPELFFEDHHAILEQLLARA